MVITKKRVFVCSQATTSSLSWRKLAQGDIDRHPVCCSTSHLASRPPTNIRPITLLSSTSNLRWTKWQRTLVRVSVVWRNVAGCTEIHRLVLGLIPGASAAQPADGFPESLLFQDAVESLSSVGPGRALWWLAAALFARVLCWIFLAFALTTILFTFGLAAVSLGWGSIGWTLAATEALAPRVLRRWRWCDDSWELMTVCYGNVCVVERVVQRIFPEPGATTSTTVYWSALSRGCGLTVGNVVALRLAGFEQHLVEVV